MTKTMVKSAQLDQLERILTFNQVGMRIQEELDVENIYRIIGEGLKEIGLNCGIMFLDEEHKNLQLKYISTLPSLVAKAEKLLNVKAVGFEIPVEREVIVMTAIRERRAIYTTKGVNIIKEMVPSIRHAPLLSQAAKMLGLNHSIAAPLIARGKVFGALAVYSRNIPEEDIPIVVAFANQAAIAIDNAARLPLEFEVKARELEKSEEKYRQLLENMKDGYALVQDAEVIFANRRLEEIFDYGPGQMIGLNVTELIAQKDLLEIMEVYMKVVGGEEEEPERIEFMALKKSGITFPIQCGVNTIEYEGKPAFSIIVRDITDRKQAEDKYRHILDGINDGYVLYQGSGVVLANKRFAEIFGYEVEQLLGQNFYTFVSPDSLESVAEMYSRIVGGEEEIPERLEIEGIKRDGTKILLDLSVKTIEYEGKPAFSAVFRDITKQKEAEEALHSSEEHFRSLIENTYDIIMVLDADGAIRYTSSSIERVLGFEPEELTGKKAFDFLHPDDMPYIIDSFAKAIQKPGYANSLEMRTRHKDGSWRIVQGTGVNLLNEPSVAGIVANFHDITESRQAEEQIKSSEERLRILFEFAPDAYYLSDLAGTFLDGNKAAEELTGYQREELIGKNFLNLDLLPEDQILKAGAFLIESIQGRPTGPEEYTLNRKDGGQVQVEIRTFPVKIRGKPVVLGIARDITERKRAEEALQQSEKHYRSLIENISDVILVINDDGTVRYISPSVEKVLGYKPEEWIGEVGFKMIHPEDVVIAVNAFNKGVQMSGYSESVEVRVCHKDGSWRVVQSIGVALLDDPSVAGVVINFRDITERKQMEEELRESEELYRNLVETADKIGQGIALAQDIEDQEGIITFTNDEFLRITGYKREEIIGTTLQNLLESESLSELMDLYRRNQAGEDVRRYADLFFVRKNGTKVPIELGAGYLTYQGKASAIAFVKDITERKSIEEALRNEAIRRHILVDQSRDGIVILDQDGLVYEANQQFAEMLGYSSEEILQLSVIDWEFLYPPEQTLEMIRTVDETGDHFETQHRRKDGSIYDVEISTNAAIFAGQKLIFCICRDITERKRAEELLKKSQESYRDLVENINDAIFAVDEKGLVNYVSPVIESIIEYRPSELLGCSLDDFVYQKDASRMRKHIKMSLSGHDISGEYRVLTKSGQIRWVHTSIRPIYTGDQIIGVRGVVADITDRKKAEQEIQKYWENLERMVKERTRQLEDANKALVRTEKLAVVGELAGAMAHDLRNPLGVVKNSTCFLRMKLANSEDEKLARHLNMMDANIETCNQIIMDLLDFAQPDRAKVGDVDINQLVQKTAQTALLSQGMEISTNLTQDLPMIVADVRQLERVFFNLVSNAIEAMSDGGMLSIATGQQDGFIQVRVTDNGVGIPQENLDRIFEPLFTTKDTGVGLGLAFVRTLVERLDGSIEVDSQVGKGSTFTIKLPIASDK